MRLFIFLANSEVQRNQRKSQASFQRKIGPNSSNVSRCSTTCSEIQNCIAVEQFTEEIKGFKIMGKVKTLWGK